MVDAIQNLAPAPARAPDPAPLGAARPAPRGLGKRTSFQEVLERGMRTHATTARPPIATTARPPIATTAHPPATIRAAQPQAATAIRPRTTPEEADAALTEAMAREFVPESWREGLALIMQRESRGQVDARNPIHSARGLFQLTRANYHLNPNGEASFGNGVEEAQGGIRYIQQRYGTPEAAVAHWQKRGWY